MSDQASPPTDIRKEDAPYVVFSGFCMGSADVVPGVSGGTMAVALGIYHQLLAAITSANGQVLKAALSGKLKQAFELLHWRFIASLGLGLALGIGLMVRVIKLPLLVASSSPHRPLVYAIFFGMVLGSAVILTRHVQDWNPLRVFALLSGVGFGYLVVSQVPQSTPDAAWFVFLCGCVAICAMLLPGISGSFILLIMGKYAYILGALSSLDLGVILPFVAGCLVGLLSFARFLKWLLDQWHHTVLASLIGLLFGSLYRIWPYQHLTEVIVRKKPRIIGAVPYLPEKLEVSLLLAFVAGIAFVVFVELYAARRRASQQDAAADETADAA